MPDIIDPTVIRFVDEQVRPMAEILRALSDRIDGMLSSYFVQVNPLLGGNTGVDPVLDGRETEGVSSLLLSDVQGLITQMQTIQTQFALGGVMDVITKPTVRAPGATVSL